LHKTFLQRESTGEGQIKVLSVVQMLHNESEVFISVFRTQQTP